jgi:Domain of unknown function (DUF4157)
MSHRTVARKPSNTTLHAALGSEATLIFARSAVAGASIDRAPPIVDEVLRSPGQPLDASMQARMSSRFGHDFSRVRVHADAVANASAVAVGARAYTVGHDVVFGPAAYAPATSAGERLLAHELAHTIQQHGAPSGASSLLRVDSAGSPAETQAESAGEAALAVESRRPDPASLTGRPQGHAAVLARKADPARVATMSPAAILADPDYIDNNLRSMEFFSAEMAILHYKDGATLTIGLVPQWIKPPLESVDYHAAPTEHARVRNPDELQFVPRVRELPAGRDMPYQELLRRFTVTVRFSVDPTSGKIVPNHLNTITAPLVSRLLLESEAQYAKNVDEIAQGAVKIFSAMKVVVELALFRAMLGGPKTARPRVAPAAGEVIGKSVLSRAGTVTVETAVQRGLVKESGRLVQVLRAIQSRFVAADPKTLEAGMEVVGSATKAVGLETGVITAGGFTQGFVELSNVGGVVTRILSTGEIVVIQGSNVLLRLMP